MIYLVYISTLIIFIIVAEIFMDIREFNDPEEFIDHKGKIPLRGIAILYANFINLLLIYPISKHDDILTGVGCFIYSLGLYWILFDIGIAKVVLNKEWYYLGNTSKLDKIGKITNFTLKAGLIIISIILLI